MAEKATHAASRPQSGDAADTSSRGQAVELLPSKLMAPRSRSNIVSRPGLLERLRDADGPPIVTIVAPAGYGKTTLLAEWAQRNGQGFAWVSLDEQDNDPKVLLTYVAASLEGIEPIDPGVFDALASPQSSVAGVVAPRLGKAFASIARPFVLVLDDVHLLHSREGQAAIAVLVDNVPEGSRIAIAARREPPLRLARLRAQGRVLELGPRDLSLDREQSAELLLGAGVELSEADVTGLHEKTEGWPVGLYLAALAIRSGGSVSKAVAAFGGDDLFVSEYLHFEVLSRMPEEQIQFLRRSAVLDSMSGLLCDAVLQETGSDEMLARLQRSNHLLIPLDRHAEWYRYHHLFRDMLLTELERSEPGIRATLLRRAADWCEQNGRPEEALEYSMSAGDEEGGGSADRHACAAHVSARSHLDAAAMVRMAAGSRASRSVSPRRGARLVALRAHGAFS